LEKQSLNPTKRKKSPKKKTAKINQKKKINLLKKK